MKNVRVFYLISFQFLEVKFSIYLNRRVFVMIGPSKLRQNQCLDIYYTNDVG